jgi:Flp pilus assembly pilin Flp
MNPLRRFWRAESGQDLVEYSLLLTVVLLGSAGLMINSQTSISTVWTATSSALVGQLSLNGSSNSPTQGGTTGSGGSSGSGSGSTDTTGGGDHDGGHDH